MDAIELDMHRRNTEAFINAKPVSIILTPQVKTRQASGGYKLADGVARAPQTFRIVELGLNQTPPILQLTDGKQREAEFLLLGLHNASIAIDDYWTASDGREWLVGDIVRSNLYETRALVTERGR